MKVLLLQVSTCFAAHLLVFNKCKGLIEFDHFEAQL